MARADIEAAAREKYPADLWSKEHPHDAQRYRQEGYIQGRLDQAEADAQIARSTSENEPDVSWPCATVRAVTGDGSSSNTERSEQ